MSKILDIGGQKYGRLTALEFAKVHKGQAAWIFACDCGAIKTIVSANVRYGATRSCGCLHSEAAAARNIKHGKSKTAEYSAWVSMRVRCNRPKSTRYERWGGRGIKVCPEWDRLDGFELFLAHVGPRPSAKHSIDRIDNSLGYEPGNVRWATSMEQARNTSRNHWIEFRGERMIQGDWALRLGITAAALRERIRRWGIERALTTIKAEFDAEQRRRKEAGK